MASALNHYRRRLLRPTFTILLLLAEPAFKTLDSVFARELTVGGLSDGMTPRAE